VQAALVEAYRSVGGGGAEAEAVAAAATAAKAEAAGLRAQVARLEQQLEEQLRAKDRAGNSTRPPSSDISSGSSSSGSGSEKAGGDGSGRDGAAGGDGSVSNGSSEALELARAEERAAWVAERAALALQTDALRVEVGGTERILAEAAARVAFLEREAAAAGQAGFQEGHAEGAALGVARGRAQAEASAAAHQVRYSTSRIAFSLFLTFFASLAVHSFFFSSPHSSPIVYSRRLT
jgi:hypothetical protein